MKDNEQEAHMFSNPICKQTYNSLPKIYGGRGNKDSIQRLKKILINVPHRHNCLQNDEEEKKKSPINKRYSHSKSRYLSMPKTDKCSKKHCSCNLIHEEEQKTLRKAASSISPKKKIKLKPLLFAKPDDFQSEHKVIMKVCTQPSMPTGLASIISSQRNLGLKSFKHNQPGQGQQSFINEILDENEYDQEQTKRYCTHEHQQQNENENRVNIPRSLTEQIAIGTMDNLPQIESQPYSFESNLSRVTGMPAKEVACVEVQVDLFNDAIEKRSEKSEEEVGVGTQTNQRSQPQPSVREKTDQSRYKRLSRARKTKFYISEEQDNEESQIYDDEQKKRAKEKQNLANSRRSSSSLSLTSCLVKGLNSNTTQFKKLAEREGKEELKGSRAKSTKSNGTFRIPSQQDYVSYLKSYRVLDKKNFNLKELVKKPLFSIVEEEEGVYFGQYENEIKNGSGINVTEKQIFEGVYDNNRKVKGCERNIDGVYKGYFVNGKREGYGTFQWNNGEKFEGNWKEGVKCGFGIWRSPKGDSYEGQWLNNRQHGEGVFKHKNSTYKGEFENFLKHGKGEEIFINGDSYVGDYKFGKPDGFGKYTWHQGGFYQGQFKNGIRSGQGKLIEANGNIYTGQFHQDFKHGNGTQEYKTGQSFVGSFDKGKELKGTFHKKEGKAEYIDNS